MNYTAGHLAETQNMSKDRGLACPLVSIVINNYNYAQFLRASIESALGQTYRNLEVIVVDDGSTDDSVLLLERHYLHRIPVLFQNNRGQSAAVNLGFRAARGDIVIFLDSDDLLHPNAVETIAGHWQDSLAKVQFPLNAIDAEGREMGIRVPRLPLDFGDVTGLLLEHGHYVTPPMSGNAFAKRALERLMPIPEDWRFTGCGADAYLLHAIPFLGSIQSIEQPLGSYRIHGRNLSTQAQQSNGSSIPRLKAYLATELAVRRVIETQANNHGRSLSRHAIVENYSCLKARFALKKLGGRIEGLPDKSLLNLAWMLVKAVWRSHGLNFPARCAFLCWTAVTIAAPPAISNQVLSLGLTPANRPNWLRKLLLLLSWRKAKQPAIAR